MRTNIQNTKSLNLINPSISLCQGSTGIVDSSGYSWGAGHNYFGQLGDGTIYTKIKFVSLIKSDVMWKQVAVGTTSFLLDQNGMIWGIGGPLVGIGDNTVNLYSSPVMIARSSSYTFIATGSTSDTHLTAAIDGSNGMIWTWGAGLNGGLGDNTTVNKSSPVMIARSSSYKKVGICYSNTSIAGAIDGATGMIWVWGAGATVGQLGINSASINKSSPVALARSASYSDIAIAYGGMAIDGSDGSVWSWGYNGFGQIGDNTTNNRSSPVSVNVAGSFISIVKSDYTSYALRSDGVLFSWGYNRSGELGIGNFTSMSIPTSVASNVKAIYTTVGNIRNITVSGSLLFLDNAGTIWGCGSNTWGQFGNGCFSSSVSPMSFSRSTTPIGGNYYLIVSKDANGMIYSNGFDNYSYGMFGTNSILTGTVSLTSIARSGSYTKIVSDGSYNTIAIDGSDGSVWTWGSNTYGNLGDGTTTTRSSPVSIKRPGSYCTVTAGGANYLMGAIDGSNGSVWIWGYGSYMGDGSTTSRSSPVAIARVGSYKEISGGVTVMGAVDGATGMVYTWGAGTNGQLGDNTSTTKNSPVAIARSGSYHHLNIAFGSGGSCGAIDGSTGMIWMWGINNSGTVGDNTTAHKSSPVMVARSSSYSFLFCGILNSIAIDGLDGSVWAWGQNIYGQCGNPDIVGVNISSPVSVCIPTSCVTAYTNSGISWAVDYQGIVWMWGNSEYGVISSSEMYSSPVSIGAVLLR